MRKIYTDLRKPCTRKFAECPDMTEEERREFAEQRVQWIRDRKEKFKAKERDRKYKEVLAAGPRVAKICKPCEKRAQERYSKKHRRGKHDSRNVDIQQGRDYQAVPRPAGKDET
jgi:hypothetical protein